MRSEKKMFSCEMCGGYGNCFEVIGSDKKTYMYCGDCEGWEFSCEVCCRLFEIDVDGVSFGDGTWVCCECVEYELEKKIVVEGDVI